MRPAGRARASVAQSAIRPNRARARSGSPRRAARDRPGLPTGCQCVSINPVVVSKPSVLSVRACEKQHNSDRTCEEQHNSDRACEKQHYSDRTCEQQHDSDRVQHNSDWVYRRAACDRLGLLTGCQCVSVNTVCQCVSVNPVRGVLCVRARAKRALQGGGDAARGPGSVRGASPRRRLMQRLVSEYRRADS